MISFVVFSQKAGIGIVGRTQGIVANGEKVIPLSSR